MKYIDKWAITFFTASYFGLDIEDLRGPRTLKKFVTPRHISMAMCYDMLDVSNPDVGAFFNRHHTTVLYARRYLPMAIRKEGALANDIENIKAALTYMSSRTDLPTSSFERRCIIEGEFRCYNNIAAFICDVGKYSEYDLEKIYIQDIAFMTAAYYRISLNELRGVSQKKEYVRPRHIAMHLIHSIMSCTVTSIAAYFYRDRQTVRYGIDRGARYVAERDDIKADIEQIKLALLRLQRRRAMPVAAEARIGLLTAELEVSEVACSFFRFSMSYRPKQKATPSYGEKPRHSPKPLNNGRILEPA